MNGRDGQDHTYAFLDCGDGRRLERFGGVVVSRPAPAATWRPGLHDADWSAATACYDHESGWRGTPPPVRWLVAFGPAVLGLHPASRGQIGVFPEHAAVAERLATAATSAGADGRRVLNLFAHTGLVTLRLAATPGVSVTHVDAMRSSVRQARENAVLSGLGESPVRWLVDDALRFLAREVRRGNRYDVVVADPPSFGRAGRNEWKMSRDLPELIGRAGQVLSETGTLCLTCHTEGMTEEDLAGIAAAGGRKRDRMETGRLTLQPEGEGRPLVTGVVLYAGGVL